MVESMATGVVPRYGTVVVLGLALLATTPGRAAERSDFTGAWKRNPTQSQQWREKVEALTDSTGRGDQPERRLFRSWLLRVLGELDSV